ncbi:proton-coupled zinc antiporter SLC30A2-like isoform X3 [Danaus plexippus]|uniref:UDP-glucose:glycoprotein glucosyltransferase n=1 Tax=Danaus plexippus plexippus TaxID=278856 RepID=A0A212EYW4_DANPL|nr:proton-coupled zinc antiporter SLC30A2-like isoform X3 [Danaus plexippus]OWR46682.1 UDP-glucose:glycoprotein glucosyltransferase [Danaus plexippus plexippus]
MTEDTKPLLLFKDAKASYGTDNPARGRRVIFCVHGNPSTGCCAVIETSADGDEVARTNSITEERHCHRSRNEEIDKRARRKLIIASVLCVIFMIGEIVGGYLSNSLAIATDAAHLLTDFASFMISLFSLWVASRPATRRMPFGWYRAEVIGALTSVLLIWVVTGILLYMAVQRVIYKSFEIDATVMLITSAVGVAVNLVMGLTLHQHGHSHGGQAGHGHSHGGANPVLNNKERVDSDAESSSSHTQEVHSHTHGENINVRAAFIHVLGDFLQSFGVLVAAIVIYFKPEWSLVDPICTFLFSVLVLLTTYNIIKDALLVLMEGSPRGVDFQEVANTFLSLPGVVRVHNLRMWALSLDKTALAAHLAIRSGVSPQKVLEQATRLVHEKYNFFEMTLQIEEFSDVMEQCRQCEMPSA